MGGRPLGLFWPERGWGPWGDFRAPSCTGVSGRTVPSPVTVRISQVSPQIISPEAQRGPCRPETDLRRGPRLPSSCPPTARGGTQEGFSEEVTSALVVVKTEQRKRVGGGRKGSSRGKPGQCCPRRGVARGQAASGSWRSWLRIPALPLPCCVALGTSPDFSGCVSSPAE